VGKVPRDERRHGQGKTDQKSVEEALALQR
jgi:hypothetical protein